MIHDVNVNLVWVEQPGIQAVTDAENLLLSSWWNTDLAGQEADELCRWRFFDLPGSELVMAYEDRRCVAIIASYTRPYRMGSRVIMVREPSDWFCLPEFRHLGIGLQLMELLMEKPEPILAIGGTEDQRTLLPEMGWQQMPDLATYTLPLTTRWLADKALRRLAPGRAGMLEYLPPWPRYLPWIHLLRKRSGAPMLECWGRNQQHLPEVTPSGDTTCVVPLLRDGEWEWLRQAPPRLGTFFHLAFSWGGPVEGVVLGRLYRDDGLMRAKLMHVLVRDPSARSYEAMLHETVRYVRTQGADIVYCSASCRMLQSALEALKFRRSLVRPAYLWRAGMAVAAGELCLTSVHADNGIRPF